MLKRNLIIIALGLFNLVSCSKKVTGVVFIENNLDFKRNQEVVELSKDALQVDNLENLGVKDFETGKLLVTQLVDLDGDNQMDQLLFQPSIEANSKKKYEIIKLGKTEQVQAQELCYSRFVPERTDDYTWENDKVAFRVYGPTAQSLMEEGKKGGTLSSGVDAWLKRVEYPVIDKWYKETLVDKTGSYHKDTGEGLDNFHVGVSRGVGGIAIKADDTLFYSKNYTKWKTIATGPLRTSFYLEYASWDAGGKEIQESKVLTLDLGNNLTKFDTKITNTDYIYAGLTLHEKDGVVSEENQFVSYWQPHADSELGTAILATQNTFSGSEVYDVPEKDLSNAYAKLRVVDNQVVYYAGFAWQKSEQYPTKELWEAYLSTFAKQLESPLKVYIVN
ncbi:DUF4861 family protein [Flavicella marina]|uniref:DUF4861 family protein n=1 Tax=Flavicella marina TaxID=1475951 RepID=UPI001265987C|nr:DUF4861 family protein [Flavicella marina]